MTHTPGPWFVVGRPGYEALEIHAPHRRVAKSLYHMGSEDTEADANARLIAVAPEMFGRLEAAEQTLRNLAHGFLDGEANTIAHNEAANIRAIIAKAKGEQA